MGDLVIDGSFGEGGGQILRSSLALSLVTKRPIIIKNIRANRPQGGGLKLQHLTSVKAAIEVGGAMCEGAELKSTTLVFRPSAANKGGQFKFTISSAGSAILVLQTILPALCIAENPSVIQITGGTHASMAPPFDHFVNTFLPFIAKLGPMVKAELIRPGFFPAGGGEINLSIQPCSKLNPFTLLAAGAHVSHSVTILTSRIPEGVAKTERDFFVANKWDPSAIKVVNITNSPGPGNAILVQSVNANITETFSSFGSRTEKPADTARAAQRQLDVYNEIGAPVGEYTADQMMLPLGICAWQGQGASSFRTGPLSLHSTTHVEILKMFLGISIEAVPVEAEGREKKGQVDVRISATK